MVINRVRLVNVFFVLIAILSLVGGYLYFSKTPAEPKQQISTPQPSSDIEVVAKNLEVPWALAFLPDNTMLVTERAGRLGKITAEGKLQILHTINEVKQIGEGGLHGITIDPDFNTNHFIYLYYTYGQSGNLTLNQVVRFKLEQDSVTEDIVIIDQIPGAMSHDGGRLKFGPDGYLYVTTGDAQNPSLSQDPNSLAGKILRVKNPSTDSGQVEVYSLGHRNPQGITWDNQGRLWETEHGSQATDEINIIETGKNYGWPIIRGDQKQAGLEPPILQSGSQTWAPAGAAFYQGSVYFGGLKGQALYQVKLDTLELKEHFKGQFGRIRDVVLGPDQRLYITTSNRDGRGSPTPDDDQIIRLNLQP